MKKPVFLDFLVPCVVLAVATCLLAVADADLRIESFFYRPGSGWIYGSDEPWRFLYRYGPLPGLLLGAYSLALFLAGFVSGRAARFRKQSLFLVLLIALGPGLVTSGFKDMWGRPRPRQVEQLGGEQKYHQVWQTGVAGKGKSFPSGHASIAFYLIAPFFVLRRSRAGRAYLFLVLGLLYGTLMGLARMVQGGHFPSDVLWSAGLVYLTGAALYHAVFRAGEGASPGTAPPGPGN